MWRSALQARWGNSAAGRAAMGRAKVQEFNDATPEGSLSGTKGSKEYDAKQKKPEFQTESHSYNFRNHLGPRPKKVKRAS